MPLLDKQSFQEKEKSLRNICKFNGTYQRNKWWLYIVLVTDSILRLETAFRCYLISLLILYVCAFSIACCDVIVQSIIMGGSEYNGYNYDCTNNNNTDNNGTDYHTYNYKYSNKDVRHKSKTDEIESDKLLNDYNLVNGVYFYCLNLK